MMKSQDTILICPTIASQVGAVAALDVGRAYCEPHVRELAAIRDIVVSRAVGARAAGQRAGRRRRVLRAAAREHRRSIRCASPSG